tara:strand:- start:1862 stop:2221 length:360 start_codon:yes stop_codon:yes gene_type:complete
MSHKKIEKIRLKNNSNTLKILRLAFQFYPQESQKIMLEINEGDFKISQLLKEFTLTPHRPNEEILIELETLRAQNNTPWMNLYKLAHKGSYEEYIKLKENSERHSKEIVELEEELWEHL